MNADELVRAVRGHLDEWERNAQDLHEDDCAAGIYRFDAPCWCDRPAAVLRLIAALREIAERHQPRMLPAMPYRPAMAECEHCASQCHSRSGLGCAEPIDAPWPCPDFAALASGLGINPETEKRSES